MSHDKKKNQLQPFHEKSFGDLLQFIDSFFQDTLHQLKAPRFIPVNQYESDSEYIIEAELPGVSKDQITLDIYQNYIKIAVQSEEILEEKDDNNQTIRHNSRFERAERVVSVPFTINETELDAELANGVLKIRIPNKRKRIEIK